MNIFNKQLERIMSKKRRHPHRKKKHPVLKVILILVVLILVAIGAIVYSMYKNVDRTFSNSYMNYPKTTQVDLKKSQPFTTLIIETGTNNSKKVAYAAVLASTNKTTKQTTFMNFPVFATLPNTKTINDIYSSEGTTGLIQSIKDLMNVSVNKVVQIDIDKMGSLIEATGGVSMQNPRAFNAEGYEFKQGTINLKTADQVQAYLTQLDDADLDASITRIQNVSMALYGNVQNIVRSKKIQNINYYRDILSAFTNMAKTNVNFDEAKTIGLNYNKALMHTSKLNLHTTDEAGKEVVSQVELDSVKALFEKTLK